MGRGTDIIIYWQHIKIPYGLSGVGVKAAVPREEEGDGAQHTPHCIVTGPDRDLDFWSEHRMFVYMVIITYLLCQTNQIFFAHIYLMK